MGVSPPKPRPLARIPLPTPTPRGPFLATPNRNLWCEKNHQAGAGSKEARGLCPVPPQSCAEADISQKLPLAIISLCVAGWRFIQQLSALPF